ncbi:MAG: tetratricopeptide repeat protein [Candidatus Saccharicenans sp.]|uniref:tetratricopeptide repeat protein n=1 Tax=Candidatus Saccharicenans sp. TaxID=2819258 RepID=UPI00404BA457
MGIYYGELRDYERQEKFYKEADKVTNWNAPLFNLALCYFYRGKYQEALETIKATITKGGENGANLTLKALILEKGFPGKNCQAIYKQALEAFDELSLLDDWQLNWYLTAAERLGNKKLLMEAMAEKIRRKRSGQAGAEVDAPLPAIKGNIMKKGK